MKTRLSVNINKVALIRNARGNDFPNLVKFAQDCEAFGAEGITVHPRPDERHVTFADIPALKAVVKTEFNIEGNPNLKRFNEVVLANKPHQVTLVPDADNALTSDHGWDTISYHDFLVDKIAMFKEAGIRTSIFCNADPRMVEGAKKVGTDRIEFYTGPYAHDYSTDRAAAVKAYAEAAKVASAIDLGINAGHDLNLDNLTYFKDNVANLLEVSIGQALVVDALYYGIQNTIQMYLHRLK